MEFGLFLNLFSTDKSVLSFWLSDGIFQIMSKDAHINGYFGMKLNLKVKGLLLLAQALVLVKVQLRC